MPAVNAGDDTMAAMPSAGPDAMSVATAVTEPGVVRSETPALSLGVPARPRTMSGVPPVRVASSANGATGRSSGTSTSATSDVASVPTTEACSSFPPAPTMAMLRTPVNRSAVVATIPPSATATPRRWTVPFDVSAWSSTMDLAAV